MESYYHTATVGLIKSITLSHMTLFSKPSRSQTKVVSLEEVRISKEENHIGVGRIHLSVTFPLLKQHSKRKHDLLSKPSEILHVGMYQMG